MQRNFLRDTLICVIPCLIAAGLTYRAYSKYQAGEGGFNLGVDLAGGTILIYEVDEARDKQLRELQQATGAAYDSRKTDISKLAEALKRRIDPADQYNVTVRGAGDSRVEIILPTGGASTSGKKNFTQSRIDDVKRRIEKVGRLEFMIVANDVDDKRGFEEAQAYFNTYANLSPDDSEEIKQTIRFKPDPSKEEYKTIEETMRMPKKLAEYARLGMPPPPLMPAPGEAAWMVSTSDDPADKEGRPATYAWVKIGLSTRKDLGLQNRVGLAAEANSLWKRMEAGRLSNQPVLFQGEQGGQSFLMYSRPCLNTNLSPEQRQIEGIEYFILMRASDHMVVDGKRITISAKSDIDGRTFRPCVAFNFNSEGGREFFKLSSMNTPSKSGVKRQLGIILDAELISYPTLQSAISDSGQITGSFDQAYVNEIVNLLRSGALPATLKRTPVSENSVSPTLGADTIRSGTLAILIAFIAILVFMLIYYRFAGFVACVALLANLLLTVGFMVAFNAAFTLPGLAGLVLMLGMAVDANVLIYERLREERDRGATLVAAIRNAYDRAFPTIIDTHLSSIFTAIILYAVGNDQLKGFGVSLTVGLVISLFTSLFMTRLMFDFWLKKGWITNLSMLRLLTRPKIDFMAIRYPMFVATGVISVIGIAVFLMRGSKGMNVDFVGGVVYGGNTKVETDIGQLRNLLSEQRQQMLLQVDSVEKEADSGDLHVWKINYVGGESVTVQLANEPEGQTVEQQAENLKARASVLPDWSVEQNFSSTDTGDKSRRFTVRTTEMEPELVKVTINRLFTEDKNTLLVKSHLDTEKDGKTWLLKFSDTEKNEPTYASPAYIKILLEREFTRVLKTDKDGDEVLVEPFRLDGVGEPVDGRFSTMRLTLSSEAERRLKPEMVEGVLSRVKDEYNSRPQPERLETFDPTLAGEMRTRAFYAILASWLAILVYLWLRFGNWTFGAAAVICLIHDLSLTLGAIAFCHYIADTTIGKLLRLQDFKIDLPAVAALLTLVGYSVNDTIVVFDRIREVRGKNPHLNPQMINDSVNQTLSRTILASLTVFLVVGTLYLFGGEGVHLFAFVMVVGVIVGTYSSIYIASPLLLMFGEGKHEDQLVGLPAVEAEGAKA